MIPTTRDGLIDTRRLFGSRDIGCPHARIRWMEKLWRARVYMRSRRKYGPLRFGSAA